MHSYQLKVHCITQKIKKKLTDDSGVALQFSE